MLNHTTEKECQSSGAYFDGDSGRTYMLGWVGNLFICLSDFETHCRKNFVTIIKHLQLLVISRWLLFVGKEKVGFIYSPSS